MKRASGTISFNSWIVLRLVTKLTCYGACHRPNECLPHEGFGQKSLNSIAAGLGWGGLVPIASYSHLVMEAILGELTFGLAGGKDVLCNLHVVPLGNSVKPEPMQRRVKSSDIWSSHSISLWLQSPSNNKSTAQSLHIDSSIATQ